MRKFELFKTFGKKKLDFDENEPTGLVFHGRKEKNLRKGFRLGGYPSGKTRKGKKKDLPGGFLV